VCVCVCVCICVFDLCLCIYLCVFTCVCGGREHTTLPCEMVVSIFPLIFHPS
jgi:hypothetical protein